MTLLANVLQALEPLLHIQRPEDVAEDNDGTLDDPSVLPYLELKEQGLVHQAQSLVVRFLCGAEGSEVNPQHLEALRRYYPVTLHSSPNGSGLLGDVKIGLWTLGIEA